MAQTKKNNDIIAKDGTVYSGGKSRVKVFFPKVPGVHPKDQEDIIFSINGETIQIQRGVEVEIPEYFASAIQDNLAFKEEADFYISKTTG